jgi:hypothetical protein
LATIGTSRRSIVLEPFCSKQSRAPIHGSSVKEWAVFFTLPSPRVKISPISLHMSFALQPLPLPASIELESPAVLRQLARSHRHLAELKGAAATIPNEAILIDTLALHSMTGMGAPVAS